MSRQTELELTAALLKQCRQLLGWSQRELAERTGLHEQTVKYWEGKQGIIAGWAVERMAEKLAFANMFYGPTETRTSKLCGARTRKGHPCKAKALPGKARCKFHGGMSTGPRTAEGRQRIREAQRRRWAARREEPHRSFRSGEL